ncbi:hypothetical protein TSAR_011817 [Trichomalopsis sarcophagae]|uniref:C2H2-type domain-containing protein n=1 Tax=Trichomalopsis sarcophagae TaxID=543379 RepID=A0A232F5M6_9HYME|nr:hypothetical protein TSAR_011817 [Trichomalopsis sarcophagae]
MARYTLLDILTYWLPSHATAESESCWRDQQVSRVHVCQQCGKSYAVHRSLWRHQKFECVNSMPKLSCDICNYQSPHKWCIDNHKRKRHSKII